MTSAHPRNTNLDSIRIVAMLMVLVLHTFKNFVERPDFFNTPLYYLLLPIVVWSAPAVQVFFLLSGYLVLSKPKSIAENWSKTWRRLVVPLAAFEALAVLNVISVTVANGAGIQSALAAELERITRFPNSELWFLYVLTAFYLLNPVFFSLFREGQKRTAQYVILLVLGAPIVLVSLEYPVGRFDQTYINVTSQLWCLFFYLYGGLLAQGWGISRKATWWGSLLAGATALLMGVNYVLAKAGVQLITLNDTTYWLLHILGQLLVAVLAVSSFQLLLAAKWPSLLSGVWLSRGKTFVTQLAVLSFGVYLIHPLLIDPVLRYWFNWHFDAVGLHPILFVILNFGIVLLGSLGLSWLVYKTPWLRVILGEKPKPAS